MENKGAPTREQVMAYFKKVSSMTGVPISGDQENRNVAAQDNSFRANLASILSGQNAAIKPTQAMTPSQIQMLASGAGMSGRTAAGTATMTQNSTLQTAH